MTFPWLLTYTKRIFQNSMTFPWLLTYTKRWHDFSDLEISVSNFMIFSNVHDLYDLWYSSKCSQLPQHFRLFRNLTEDTYSTRPPWFKTLHLCRIHTHLDSYNDCFMSFPASRVNYSTVTPLTKVKYERQHTDVTENCPKRIGYWIQFPRNDIL